MKILFIGDPHLKITRFDLAKKFLTWLNQLIKEQQPDLVVNLGDTFDTHAVLRSEVMSEFMSHVEYVASLGITYVYVLGNHDMYKPNDATYHALLPFKGKIDKFIVVDQITDLHDITFVPYQHDISKFPTNTKTICVAHQTFQGADYGDIRTKEGVASGSVLADIIISGHIHKRQVLDGTKVIYPGSPFSQSANDVDQVKGVMLFDTSTYKDTFIACPLPMWHSRSFELSPSLTTSDVYTTLLTDLNDVDHWLVEMKGPKAEVLGFLDAKETKSLFSGKNIKMKTSFTDKDKRQVKISAMSMEQIISEYVTKIYSGTIDKELLQQKALEILAASRQR